VRCAIGLVQWLPPLKCIFFTGSPGYDPNAAPQGPPRPGTAGTAGKNLYYMIIFSYFEVKFFTIFTELEQYLLVPLLFLLSKQFKFYFYLFFI